MKKIYYYTIDHFVEILVLSFFLVSMGLVLYHHDTVIEDFKSYAMPIVVMIGFFLTWLQFMFHKSNKKKEATLTYFPRPMELEKIEHEIDEVINFWSREEPLDNYEVKLLLSLPLEEAEYILVWDKLSFSIKRSILKECGIKYKGKDDILKYDTKYNKFINEYYVKTRRKLNLYLNQIEGYCLSINNGSIDSKAAKLNYAHKFERHFNKAKPYIDKMRQIKNEKDFFIQYETVLKKWEV